MVTNNLKILNEFNIGIPNEFPNYPLCPICFNAMISVHNSIFDFELNSAPFYDVITFLLLNFRFFKLSLIEDEDDGNKHVIYHLTHKNNTFCRSSMKSIIEFYYKKIEETNGIIKNEDGDKMVI